MRTIRPSSRLLPLAWEITDTKTTSPGRAPNVLSGAIKISLSFSSTVTKPKPHEQKYQFFPHQQADSKQSQAHNGVLLRHLTAHTIP